jgi:hypothetical protein
MASARSDLCKDLLDTISPGSPQDLLLYKDLYGIMQGPVREDFTTISTRSYHKDLYKIMQGPLRGFHPDLHKIFSQGRGQDFHMSRTSMTAPWNCCKIVMEGPSRKLRRFRFLAGIFGKQLRQASRHSESDLTGAKTREGCANDIKIRTTPQRERSDTHKVTRWSREQMIDFHRHPILRAPWKMNIENLKNNVLPT